MNHLYRRIALGVFLGVCVMVGFGLYGDIQQLGSHLVSFGWKVIPLALGLSFFNYLVRFIKWSYYLRLLKIKVPRTDSFVIFMSGLVMSITPGKVGELLKSFLLRESHQVPMTLTTPVVVAERMTDFIALITLTILGVAVFRTNTQALVIAVVMITLPIAVISCRPLSMACISLVSKVPKLGSLAGRLTDGYQSMRQLLTPGPLLVATGLSVFSWFAECLAFFLILNAIPGLTISLFPATFIYASSTILGAPSPGGLGLTEGGMVGMTMVLAGTERQAAITATLLTRLCTLWFAVGVGMVALVIFRRRIGLSWQPAAISSTEKET